MLDTVGWVQSVIVNRTTGYVVDGHLRVAMAISKGEALIPVSYVELDEAEENLVLAALDPVGPWRPPTTTRWTGCVSPA
jgi:ParB-like chromosome segregation protein Spo0J